MQTEHALLLTGPAVLGNSNLAEQGQVYLPVVQINSIHAPTRKRDYFTVKLTAIIPTKGAPSLNDIRWLWPGPASLLRDLHIVMVFIPGTINGIEPDAVPA